MADMFKQQIVERIHIVALCGGHLFQNIRMAANRPLTEDHHAAGQDIRTFNGDGDRRSLVRTRQEVAFAEHNAFTTGNVHCVDDGLLAAMGTMVLDDS